VKITADGQVLKLDFAVAEYFARSAHGVVYRLVEVDTVERIRAELSAEVFRIERRIVLA